MVNINPTKITVPFTAVEKVLHISDVHIRLYKRHDEYKEVFNRLLSELVHHGSVFHHSVIVVTGDLLHAKTDLSPEMVDLASDFLKKLADIAPTLIILGNHDLNLANKNRLDSLTPLIENIAHPDLYYLRNSGVYTIADHDFAVFSILESLEEWPKVDQLTAPYKVALCHAPINNAVTDSGFEIENDNLEASLFDGFDAVLLGDIHKHQVIQEYDAAAKKPLMVYAGSLIQQNHGESLTGHGWLEWDIPAHTFRFHEISNDYGYATLVIEEGKLPDLTGIPSKARLRVFAKNIEPSKLKKIQAILQKKFDLQELSITKTYDDVASTFGASSATIVDVHNVDVQSKLIEDYLLQHHAIIKEDMLSRILEINRQLNGKVAQEEFVRNVVWKPLKLEFENMYSYGMGNTIDFAAMRGVHGLFAPNATGKTSVFDALMFCLFDKTPRAFKASNIMNNRRDRFECTLTFEIGGREYGIRRVAERKKNYAVDVKCDVDFWVIEEGKRKSLNAEDRRATNAVIRRYVGTYDDFILTNLSVQGMNSLFIDKGQSERKDLLAQFMGINIFDSLYNMATDALKETSGALKNFDKEDSAKVLAEVQQQIERMEEEYAGIEAAQKEQEKKLGALTNDIARLYELKIPVNVNETDIRALEESKNTTSVTLENLQRRHEMLVHQLKELEHTSGSLAATVGKYEAESIQREYDQFVDIRIRAQEAERELKLLSRQIETDKTRLEHITTHEYNPNCEFCVRNNQVLVRTVEQIRKDLLASQKRKEEVESVLQKALPILAKEMEVLAAYEAWQTASKDLAAADRELLVIRNKMAEVNEAVIRCDIQLKEITTKVAAYYKFLDAIKQNLEIEKQISELERQRQAVLDSLRTLEVNLRELHGKLQVQKSLKAQILQQIKEIEELDQTLVAYQYYVEAVKRDGIPSELIAGVIPVLEYKINNILSQVVDFTISLEMDGKNINGKIVYDDERQWPLEMASGMERFISDLAIRSALIDVSNLPKPNFLVIDEGLSVLSPENLMSLHTLFSTLKNQFDFIVIVSHLDAVRDMVDHLMEIKIGEDGFSQINY